MVSTDDAKAKHVSQVQEDWWNNITKSCVYLQININLIGWLIQYLSRNTTALNEHLKNSRRLKGAPTSSFNS